MAVERLSQASIGTLNKYSSMMAGSAYLTDFQLISTQVLASSAASVTFSSVDQTYRHLQLRVVGRSTVASGVSSISVVFNGGASTTYYSHYLMGSGGAVSSAGFSGVYGYGFNVPGASATTGIFGSEVIDILDYTNTNKNKVMRTLGGDGANSRVGLASSLWVNTSAITSFVVSLADATNFVAGSRISLYGWN